MGDKGLYKFTRHISFAIRRGHQVNCCSGQIHGAPGTGGRARAPLSLDRD